LLLVKDAAVDLFVQRCRFLIRRYAQFLVEHLPATSVLGDSGGALAALGQKAHYPAMPSFLPWLQGQLAAGILERTFVVTSCFGSVGQLGEGVECLEMQLFLGDAAPLLKGITVGNGEAGQKVALIEVNRLA
jgi:hypothetical protein